MATAKTLVEHTPDLAQIAQKRLLHDHCYHLTAVMVVARDGGVWACGTPWSVPPVRFRFSETTNLSISHLLIIS